MGGRKQISREKDIDTLVYAIKKGEQYWEILLMVNWGKRKQSIMAFWQTYRKKLRSFTS